MYQYPLATSADADAAEIVKAAQRKAQNMGATYHGYEVINGTAYALLSWAPCPSCGATCPTETDCSGLLACGACGAN